MSYIDFVNCMVAVHRFCYKVLFVLLVGIISQCSCSFIRQNIKKSNKHDNILNGGRNLTRKPFNMNGVLTRCPLGKRTITLHQTVAHSTRHLSTGPCFCLRGRQPLQCNAYSFIVNLLMLRLRAWNDEHKEREELLRKLSQIEFKLAMLTFAGSN